ncbi:MAG: LysR family transcriptional regulator [Firmicutes bacterium]|nr:LysR family transcriptional regulator [Bacillota bacterium]
MEMKQLRSYIAVVDHGSFTKAAEKTYTSQPTVSAHIKALEEELGVQLLERDTKNLRVTQKGRELYDCACGMLALQQRMLEKWENEDRKTLSIGVSTIPSGYILPGLLEGFRSEHPDVAISIHQSDSEEIEEAVEKGACDIGFIGEEPGAALAGVPVAEDKTVLIAPNTPEFRKWIRGKDLKMLLSQPMLFREKGSASRKSAEKLLELMGRDLQDVEVAASLNDQEAIKNLVEHGFGISFISSLAAEDRVRDGRLLAFDTGLPEAKRTFYLVRRKNVQLSDSAEAFVKYVQK